MNTALLAEVLQPRPAGKRPRLVRPVDVKPGSVQENIINTAATKVRGIYARNQRVVSYDPARPEVFFDASRAAIYSNGIAMSYTRRIDEDMHL